MSDKHDPFTREDVTRLSEIGMAISGYLMRPLFGLYKSPYITEEHEATIVKACKYISNLIEVNALFEKNSKKS